MHETFQVDFSEFAADRHFDLNEPPGPGPFGCILNLISLPFTFPIWLIVRIVGWSAFRLTGKKNEWNFPICINFEKDYDDVYVKDFVASILKGRWTYAKDCDIDLMIYEKAMDEFLSRYARYTEHARTKKKKRIGGK